MPTRQIPFSALTNGELVRLHNQLARSLGHKTIKRCSSRCDLVQKLATMRTLKVPPEVVERRAKRSKIKPAAFTSRARKQPIRDAVLKLLAFVSHYELIKTGERISVRRVRDRAPGVGVVSVGLSYTEIVRRVRKRFPNAKLKNLGVRQIVHDMRNMKTGFTGYTLPTKRPRT